MWVFPGKAPLIKFKRSKSVAKQTVACFFKSGCVATIPLEDWRTVNSDWYINCWLPKALEEWCTYQLHGGTKGLQLYHHNASAHTAAASLNFPSGHSSALLTRPGFVWLVSASIHHKAFRRNTVPQPWRWLSFFEGVLFIIPQSRLLGFMERWFERMTKCINAGEGFIKKLD